MLVKIKSLSTLMDIQDTDMDHTKPLGGFEGLEMEMKESYSSFHCLYQPCSALDRLFSFNFCLIELI